MPPVDTWNPRPCGSPTPPGDAGRGTAEAIGSGADVFDDEEQMERLAAEVMPQLS